MRLTFSVCVWECHLLLMTCPSSPRTHRFNQLQPDFLRKISARINGMAAAAATRTAVAEPSFLPIATSALYGGSTPTDTDADLPSVMDEYADDVNIWNSLNLSGRREGPFYVDEPDYVLTQELGQGHALPVRLLGE